MCNLYSLTFDEILEVFYDAAWFQDFCFLFLYAATKKRNKMMKIYTLKDSAIQDITISRNICGL